MKKSEHGVGFGYLTCGILCYMVCTSMPTRVTAASSADNVTGVVTDNPIITLARTVTNLSALVHAIDSKGLQFMQSDLTNELKKVEKEWLPGNANAEALPGQHAEILFSLTKLTRQYELGRFFSYLENPTSKQADLMWQAYEPLKDLFAKNIVPVWTGTAWIDGNVLVFNGYQLSENDSRYLVSMNRWDYIIRFFSGPNGDVTGEGRGSVHVSRMALLYAGYDVKFDKTFGVWRVAGKFEERPWTMEKK